MKNYLEIRLHTHNTPNAKNNIHTHATAFQVGAAAHASLSKVSFKCFFTAIEFVL